MREDDMNHSADAFEQNRGLIKSLLFLLPGLIYLPGILGRIPYISQSAVYTDLLITHYPNALFLKKSILDFHQIPLWSTLIHSGAPFAANPLSGLFYLPGWLALLFPLPEGISISLAAHVALGSWGMYKFLRSEGATPNSAIAGGLIFGLMPKMAAHYGAGHVSLIYAISWTPWLFFISKEDQAGWKTGIVAASLFLADPRWAFYAGIFWLTFDIRRRKSGTVIEAVKYYLKSGLTGLLIAAPLLIPFYEYIQLSTRSNMGIEDVLAFSMPPEKILGLLIPGSSNPEWYIYAGGAVLGLFLLQLFSKNARKMNRFWNIWLVAGILISMGSYLFNPAWLDQIPLISLLRVPSRILFLGAFCFTVIAATTLDNLEIGTFDKRHISIIAFGLGLFSVGMGAAAVWVLGEIKIQAIWGFIFLGLGALSLSLYANIRKIKGRALLLMGFLIFDLIGAGMQSYYLKAEDTPGANESIDRVYADQDLFRIYSPSYSVPQNQAAELGLELADGVDPMQLSAYAEFMADATGVDHDRYSVTIPAFSTGDPSTDNQGAVPEPFLLSLLNVRYVISAFEIEHSELQEINKGEGNYLYLNSYPSLPAWVEQRSRNRENDLNADIRAVEEIRQTPNRIIVLAQGPGRLVLSEINYPGWKASVNGNSAPITTAYGLLRSVQLADGKNEIRFDFLPLTVYAGIVLAVIGWLLAISQITKKRR